MGLFDKKECDICGNKIGLLGNRKLDDGNLCKDCAAKLSPWFSERRHSTVQQISEQLQYRENNRQLANAFNITRSYGDNYKLLIDDNNRKFCVARGTSPLAANPDILDFSQAMGCDLVIDEDRDEKKQNVNGSMVSYNPPKYEYSYDFKVTIRVSGNPYFDDMSFNLNSSSVNTGELCMNNAATGWSVNTSRPIMNNINVTKYQEYVNMGNEIKMAIDQMRMGGGMAMGMQPNMGMNMGMQPNMSMQPNMGMGMQAGAMGGMAMQNAMNNMGMQQPQMQQMNNMGMQQPQMQQMNNMGMQQPQMQQMNNMGMQQPQMQQMNNMGMQQPQTQAAGPWDCPVCGAKTNGNFCEYCGTPRA